MRILGFDTATSATSVALADDENVLERRDDPPAGARPRHAARLMPMAAELLTEAGLSWDQLDRIAVGVGPGTFTGLRIGVSTARALARARELELVGISTLESLSLNAAAEVVCAAIDARRGEVFAAIWEHRRLAFGPAALPPAALAEKLGPETLAIGDGAIRFRDVLVQSGALIPDDDAALHRVTAVNHCRLGLLARASDPDGVLPDYQRLPDAELARRAGPAGSNS
jgi:tRNA threonylcarbamoyladenosine biosynthesis protein TsaB